MEGSFQDQQTKGLWTLRGSTPTGDKLHQWQNGLRHGVWIWPATADAPQQTVEYRDNILIRCDDQPVDVAAFHDWLLAKTQPWRLVITTSTKPYAKASDTLSCMFIELPDLRRWVEIGFPCGYSDEIEDLLVRHQVHLKDINVEQFAKPPLVTEVLLEALVRHDLVIDAVDDRLFITPRSEWSVDKFCATGIDQVDFSQRPDLQDAWKLYVDVNDAHKFDPLAAIRRLTRDTRLQVDLSAVEHLGQWKPAIEGFQSRFAPTREHFRDILFCFGLRCEQHGDKLVILPRWTMDRAANYPPVESEVIPEIKH